MNTTTVIPFSEKTLPAITHVKAENSAFERIVSTIKWIAAGIFSLISALLNACLLPFKLTSEGIYYLFPNLKTSAAPIPLHHPPKQLPSHTPPSSTHSQKTPVIAAPSKTSSPLSTPSAPSLSSSPSSREKWRTIGKVGLAAAAVGLLGAGAYGLYGALAPAAAGTVASVAVSSGAVATTAAASSALVPSLNATALALPAILPAVISNTANATLVPSAVAIAEQVARRIDNIFPGANQSLHSEARIFPYPTSGRTSRPQNPEPSLADRPWHWTAKAALSGVTLGAAYLAYRALRRPPPPASEAPPQKINNSVPKGNLEPQKELKPEIVRQHRQIQMQQQGGQGNLELNQAHVAPHLPPAPPQVQPLVTTQPELPPHPGDSSASGTSNPNIDPRQPSPNPEIPASSPSPSTPSTPNPNVTAIIPFSARNNVNRRETQQNALTTLNEPQSTEITTLATQLTRPEHRNQQFTFPSNGHQVVLSGSQVASLLTSLPEPDQLHSTLKLSYLIETPNGHERIQFSPSALPTFYAWVERQIENARSNNSLRSQFHPSAARYTSLRRNLNQMPFPNRLEQASRPFLLQNNEELSESALIDNIFNNQEWRAKIAYPAYYSANDYPSVSHSVFEPRPLQLVEVRSARFHPHPLFSRGLRAEQNNEFVEEKKEEDGFQFINLSPQDFANAPTSSKLPGLFSTVKPGDQTKGLKYLFSLNAVRDELLLQSNDSQIITKNLHILEDDRYTRSQDENLRTCARCIHNALSSLNDFEHPETIRDSYATFIARSREAFSIAKNHPNVGESLKIQLDLLKKIHHLKYTCVSMYPFYEDFLTRALLTAKPPFNIQSFELSTVAKQIEHANERLAQVQPDFQKNPFAREFEKLKGTIGVSFDPSAASNTPWVHSIQKVLDKNGSEKTIRILRHGTPTTDPGIFGAVYREGTNLLTCVANHTIGRVLGRSINPVRGFATVTEEYIAHLEADPSKITLYVNHQEFHEDKDVAIHGEGDRSAAIQGLEAHHANFHFLALPMDGVIWKKSWLNTVDEQALKSKLLESLVEGKNGFALPKRVVNDDHFKEKTKEILNHVRALYFDRELSTIKDKTAFIMIFYSYLKNYLKNELKIDFIVSACKDNKDRGNASTLVDMIITMMLLHHENDPARLEELFFSALGPFIIKNEKIIQERLDMALCVIQRIANLSDDQKNLIRETFTKVTGLQIVGQSVPKEVPSLGANIDRQNGPESQSYKLQREDEAHDIFNPNINLSEQPNFQLPELIHKMRAQKIVKMNVDPDVAKELVSDFRKSTANRQTFEWNLPKLKKQIERDLPCAEIVLNKQKMSTLENILELLNLKDIEFDKSYLESELKQDQLAKLSFLCMLHQGSTAKATDLIPTYIGENKFGLKVIQQKNKPARIDANYTPSTGAYQIRATTEQELTNLPLQILHPNLRLISYPIVASMEIRGNAIDNLAENPPAALLRWQFV